MTLRFWRLAVDRLEVLPCRVAGSVATIVALSARAEATRLYPTEATIFGDICDNYSINSCQRNFISFSKVLTPSTCSLVVAMSL